MPLEQVSLETLLVLAAKLPEDLTRRARASIDAGDRPTAQHFLRATMDAVGVHGHLRTLWLGLQRHAFEQDFDSSDYERPRRHHGSLSSPANTGAAAHSPSAAPLPPEPIPVNGGSGNPVPLVAHASGPVTTRGAAESSPCRYCGAHSLLGFHFDYCARPGGYLERDLLDRARRLS